MTDTQTNSSPDVWLDDATWLQPGDVICQQFGADLPAIERIEWLDTNRARLHHVDGTTSRVRVSAGHVRVRPRPNQETVVTTRTYAIPTRDAGTAQNMVAKRTGLTARVVGTGSTDPDTGKPEVLVEVRGNSRAHSDMLAHFAWMGW